MANFPWAWSGSKHGIKKSKTFWYGSLDIDMSEVLRYFRFKHSDRRRKYMDASSCRTSLLPPPHAPEKLGVHVNQELILWLTLADWCLVGNEGMDPNKESLLGGHSLTT